MVSFLKLSCFLLIFSLKTTGQSYSSYIIFDSVATLSTVRFTRGLVLRQKVLDIRSTETEWRACWSRYTRTDHHTNSLWRSRREIRIPVENCRFKRTTGWKHRSVDRRRRVNWAPWSEIRLAQWRENSRRRLEHGRRRDYVTVVWQRVRSREDWSGFVFDLMFSPSCATVLEPDLSIKSKKLAWVKRALHYNTISTQRQADKWLETIRIFNAVWMKNQILTT